MEKGLVTLVGGKAAGEILAVNPNQLRLVVTHERGEKVYAEGEWGRPGSPPVTTSLVEFELYERVDAETFQVVAA